MEAVGDDDDDDDAMIGVWVAEMQRSSVIRVRLHSFSSLEKPTFASKCTDAMQQEFYSSETPVRADDSPRPW